MRKWSWRMQPKEIGLRSVGAAPRGYELFYNGEVVVCVSPNGGGWRRPQRGWYWIAFDGDGVPYKNTFREPVPTVEQAKAEAHSYVKEYLK